MEFEEFFKKKRIDMVALKQVQSALFSEFETHFIQMGEKSFDHTKKYWFNKLRREFPLAVEPKTEKVKIDNPLAEQTITESLIEETASAPKLGFTPKFRAASTPNPVAETSAEEKQPSEGKPAADPAPKLGFTPKFKAAAPPKPATEETSSEGKSAEATNTPAPKLGFTPKFKAASPPKPTTEPSAEEKPAETTTPAPKLGFTPKFKAAAPTKPATEETSAKEKSAEATNTPAPKLGFTPKFKAATPPKPVADTPPTITPEESTPPATADNTAPKPAYKPRFKMQNLPKKEEEE
ncbi:hypothetical protein [Mucilaginibacter sp.]